MPSRPWAPGSSSSTSRRAESWSSSEPSPPIGDRARAEALSDLKTALEAAIPMDHNDETTFVYTTYIHATPERVWQGLTDPTFTKRYWRHPLTGGKSFPTDWQKGSTYDLVHEEVGLVVSDPEQIILESDPPARLAYTWHTFTPEWA